MEPPPSQAPTTTRQATGPQAIARALEAGEPVRLLLVRDSEHSQELSDVVEYARARGIPVKTASGATLWRLSLTDPPADALALVGRDPNASLDEVLASPAAVWLLVGVAYPGNAGFAVRTAEVSGAGGIAIDNRFERPARRETVRASMRADWFMPVFWERGCDVVDRAARAQRRIIAVEDLGERAPWEVDLTGPVLFVVGGERHGIPSELLDRADLVVRIPMAGFIPSYNLQAAMAGVAMERLRQERSGSRRSPGSEQRFLAGK